MGRLSTHVLDATIGKPASNVAIELHRLVSEGVWDAVKQTSTNTDGRTDEPLLINDAFKPGTYRLSFHIGDYFRKAGRPPVEPAFLDIVPLRFTIAEPDGQYHVPLLVTPWSYSTYRGS